jgi:putative SOS response-associated peptidase YedK
MRKLGLWAVRPKRNTSKRHPGHKVYPYLLRDKTIDQVNQVHNRTPVILPATAWRLWFGEEKRSPTFGQARITHESSRRDPNPSASSDYVQRN